MNNSTILEAELERAQADVAKHDKQIAEYEAKLKAWKAEKRAAKKRETRASEKLEQQRETERLIAQGKLADEVFDWMHSTSVTMNGQTFSVWEWWEHPERVHHSNGNSNY